MQNERNPPPERGPEERPEGASSREQIGKAVHDLRNGMNTLMMNAAVLGARINDVPEPLRPFVARIGTAGKKCSEDLAALFALVDAYRR